MYQYLSVPADVPTTATRCEHSAAIKVDEVLVKKGDRVRTGQILLYLLLPEGKRLPVLALRNGWVIFVRSAGVSVQPKELLVILDVSDYAEYRTDSGEVSPITELGKDSRRATERQGTRHFGSFAEDLFEAVAVNHSEHGQESLVQPHPKLQLQSKGAPNKISGSASDNSLAQEKFDQNNKDPEYRKQLSPQMQHQIEQRQSPAPTPTFNR